MVEIILGALAFLSFGLYIWQFVLGVRFPLHQRVPSSDRPSITLLKPLKGCDNETAECLRSWLTQDYEAPVQVLFGVATADDPVCDVVRNLISGRPDSELVICPKLLGPNAKVSTLVSLESRIQHDVVFVSDADVWAPKDLLTQLATQLSGLSCCFYRMSHGPEAFATNSDFWSQVLQSVALKPMDFALGAVMAIRRETLTKIGGFTPLLEYLADDYRLGNLVARAGDKVTLCPVVVECRSSPTAWRDHLAHQLRWSRTIRVCQPVPFFFSILSNPTIWPLAWLVTSPSQAVMATVVAMLVLRSLGGAWLERKLTREFHARSILLAPLSDLFRAVFWALAFAGNRIVWRGRKFRVSRGGKLIETK